MATSPVPDEIERREADTLTEDVARLGSLEKIVQGWDETQQRTVLALRDGWEAIYKECLRRFIRTIQSSPQGATGLREAAADPYVYAVLRTLGLVRPSLQERIEAALDNVRPGLEGHGGNVELVELRPPDTVVLRLLGSCQGCPSSSLTLSDGVEKAIREACPEIQHIETASRQYAATAPASEGAEQRVSPFAIGGRHPWLPVMGLEDLPRNGLLAQEVLSDALLFWRGPDGDVHCYRNACAHLGMPLGDGEVDPAGVLTCPHHGFRFALESGECLTVPEVQLEPWAVRVVNGEIQVRKDHD
jgi:Fe-S cluster biogenesis protein NfuA/nitrite reductase/ring-hydroxylating ferredoxin subunit